MTRLWVRTFELRVYELRGSPAIVAQRNLSQLHRTATEMMRALVMRHDTFSVFLSEPLDGLQRWQMFMILVSVVCSQLLVNIWMYYARADECCGVLRVILNSGPDGNNCPPLGPCRGFTGTCGEIMDQFAELPVLPDFPNGMQDWTCTSFPDDTNDIDSFLVGLISLAVALPVTLFIATCFEIADDSEAPESWLEWLGWRKLVFGRRAHRRWHYTGPEGQPVRYVRWFLRCHTAPISETLANLCRSFNAWVMGTEVPWLVDARQAEEEASADEQDNCCNGGDGDGESEGGSTSSSVRGAHELMQWKRMLTTAGVVGVYVTWAIFSWFIFTYGALILQRIPAARFVVSRVLDVNCRAAGVQPDWQERRGQLHPRLGRQLWAQRCHRVERHFCGGAEGRGGARRDGALAADQRHQLDGGSARLPVPAGAAVQARSAVYGAASAAAVRALEAAEILVNASIESLRVTQPRSKAPALPTT